MPRDKPHRILKNPLSAIGKGILDIDIELLRSRFVVLEEGIHIQSRFHSRHIVIVRNRQTAGNGTFSLGGSHIVPSLAPRTEIQAVEEVSVLILIISADFQIVLKFTQGRIDEPVTGLKTGDGSVSWLTFLSAK